MQLRLLCGALALLFTGLLPGAARAADATLVLDWETQAIDTIEALPRPRQSRAGVLVDLAMFNALNAIEPRYRSYGPTLEPSPQALPEAAVAAAVWGVLSAEPQANHAKLGRSYSEAIAKLPEGAARNAGVALGQRAAAALLTLRAADSFDRVDAPISAAAAGVFQPIPGRKMPFRIDPNPARPFGVARFEVFDVDPPPAADSAQARTELSEVKRLGARDGGSRNADQTAAALFWNSGEAKDELEMFKPLILARQWSALETARFLALASMADADARVIGGQLKLRYRHWRPLTALRSEFTPAEQRDAAWEPLIRTPIDPDHPSGFGLYAGTSEVVLGMLKPTMLSRFNSATSQTRNWPSIDALAGEMAESRIWAGVHFRSSVAAGRRLGRQIAEEVFATQLQPLPQ